MEVQISLNKYEAKKPLDALDCFRENWAFSYWDGLTANTLTNRIVDAFKEEGVDLEADDEEDDE